MVVFEPCESYLYLEKSRLIQCIYIMCFGEACLQRDGTINHD